MVLNTGPLNWESSTLTTKAIYQPLAVHDTSTGQIISVLSYIYIYILQAVSRSGSMEVICYLFVEVICLWPLQICS